MKKRSRKYTLKKRWEKRIQRTPCLSERQKGQWLYFGQFLKINPSLLYAKTFEQFLHIMNNPK